MEEFLQSAIFYISHRLGFPGILLVHLSIPFLIITSAPTVIGTVIVLRCHIFLFLFPVLYFNFTPSEFFAPALAGSLSLEYE